MGPLFENFQLPKDVNYFGMKSDVMSFSQKNKCF